MKLELMDILACPVCKGKLELNIEKKEANEVVSGHIHCSKCQADYPIIDTVPYLLPPDRRA